ncbi:MerR family transcriptional regulator [Umboniibacter marinipuniceus]|nr:MerR family transcriptional regulator [Umboniibacter marinipuniceus]
MSTQRYSLSELCAMSSQPISTIRELTQAGILPCEQSGMYTQEALLMLNRMSQMERLGCSKEQIQRFLGKSNP